MRKKINFHFLLVSVVSILSTLILVSCVFYDLFKKQVFYDLKCYAHVLETIDYTDENLNLGDNSKYADLRITVILSDGSVEYDSDVEADELENHKNRPEVAKAFEYGYGEDVRYSQTLDKSTFYYAELLDDGSVIRIGKETSSVYAAFTSVFPLIILIIIGLILLCVFCTILITKSLIRPIEQMADHLDDENVKPKYKELVPFVSAIQKQHKDIMRTSELRQEFTANVSHELKTPLASISGYSELIETGVASGDDVIHFAKEIHQNTNRLLVLINDIIRLSQLDSVDYAVTFEPVDLYEITENCVDMLSINATNHNVELDFAGSHVMVQGDSAMLEEVAYNLIDNAIRYNKEQGKVYVTVASNEGEAWISVKDTGIGISNEDKERIFERFYRVDKSRSKQTGGTGLGLAIVKHIVIRHGAKIEVESEPGNGTMITVRFQKLKSN